MPIKAAAIWAGLALAIGLPCYFALTSPWLQWRSSVYVVAGFAGVLAYALLLLQPLFKLSALPGLKARANLLGHRLVGSVIALAAALHIIGLWITSPPDVIDTLLFRSPAPFAPFGVVAMWALIALLVVIGLKRRLKLKPKTWQFIHKSLAIVLILSGALHALLIEGTMEFWSKLVLVLLIVISATLPILVPRAFRRLLT